MDSCPVPRSFAARFMLLSVFAACAPEEGLVDGLYAPAEWERIQTLSPLPDPPKDPTNNRQGARRLHAPADQP